MIQPALPQVERSELDLDFKSINARRAEFVARREHLLAEAKRFDSEISAIDLIKRSAVSAALTRLGFWPAWISLDTPDGIAFLDSMVQEVDRC